MNTTAYVLTALGLVSAQIGYLRLARYFGIIDRPNDRSSHTGLTTVRGGGIVFFVAELLAFWYSGFAYPFFFLGLCWVALVSFLDDVRPLPGGYRLVAQCVGMALLMYQTGAMDQNGWIVGAWLLVGVGILNAYNFMDGINGMTAWYSLVTVGTLGVWQWQRQPAGEESFLWFALIALLVFSVVNARRQAICFAGDVGSVSMAFIILLPMVELINRTHSYLPVLLLAVYGVDTVLTIGQRLYQRQNIFRAHRQHLYQWLVHRLNWPHLAVSGLYALAQLAINTVVIQAAGWPVGEQWWLAGAIVITLTGVYASLKGYLRNK
ncbi:MraY family glycosyltransferase [Spirosoma rigui]|uniref:hypothetical protein n=1 Tax=Spirosoma rigui TaxID=564064 RepID=UPI0009AF311E|nr:hypothetical protein [Spirosoma rigui]